MKKLMFIAIALFALAGTAKTQAGVSVEISLGNPFGYPVQVQPQYQPVVPNCLPAPPVYVVPRYEVPRYDFHHGYRFSRWHDARFERYHH